jgi:hypothetical protein
VNCSNISEPGCPAALAPPPGLPAGLACPPRVAQLINLDSISLGCGSDQDVRQCLEVARATARALDMQARIRCAASAWTAARHLDLLTASGNNQWSVSRRPGAAGQVLLEEMTDLAAVRLAATRPGRKRPRRAGHADLLILVGQGSRYAAPVRRLRLLGIPTWLLVPGGRVDPALYACSCAVSFLGPGLPDLTASGQLTSRLSSPLRSGRRA